MWRRRSLLSSGMVLSFLTSTVSVWAGDASLRFQYSPGEAAGQWSVSVWMENDVTMGALQFEIVHDPEVSTDPSYIDKTDTRSERLSVVQASIPKTGKLRVVMLGIGPTQVIPAGAGPILRIRFDGPSPPSLALSDAFDNQIFDTAGNAAGSIHLASRIMIAAEQTCWGQIKALFR